MSQDLLSVQDLSCGYHGHPVVEEVGFGISKAEQLGIIGPNGSGKTTLLRAITRVVRPLRGEVLLSGRDIWVVPRQEVARQIAVVSQVVEPVLMTVREYVLLGRTPYYGRFQFLESHSDAEVAQKYMELAGIVHLAGARMDELSGGERQMVRIARALAQEPSILVLDEPTAHLDIGHKVRTLDLIKHLNADLGLTVIMVLHDLNLASEYSDRLVLLDRGRIASAGRPGEVLTYEAIERAYDTTVVVHKNPLSGRPHVLLVTEDEMSRKQ